MNKSIFCLALAAALAIPMTMVAQQVIDTDKNEINLCQDNHPTMFSNIELTSEQEELVSAMENPFAEDFMIYNTGHTRADKDKGEMPDRCGGDPRFQSSKETYDLVLQELHQQRTDARVEYLQRMSQILSPEQYEQFIKNLDSMGRVE